MSIFVSPLLIENLLNSVLGEPGAPGAVGNNGLDDVSLLGLWERVGRVWSVEMSMGGVKDEAGEWDSRAKVEHAHRR